MDPVYDICKSKNMKLTKKILFLLKIVVLSGKKAFGHYFFPAFQMLFILI